jgi:Zn-dependent membrane protease YugP
MNYLLWILLPTVILAGGASWMVKTTFAKYSKIAARNGMTGAQAADHMLRSAGVNDVTIERIAGHLSDHYDPGNKTLRLSEPVFDQPSLSAVGVACHEAGHALQHAQGYIPLKLRSSMVPATGITSKLAMPVLMAGFFLRAPALIGVGAVLFACAVLFAIVTLPVEWDASARAKVEMVKCGIVTDAEADQAGKVLNAAFLTYLASAITAMMTLLYYLMRSGLLGRR